MSPILHTGIRFLAVLGVEWSTLTLLEPSPVGIKIATLALAAAVLGVLELRGRLEPWGKWAFPAGLGTLLGAYVLTCALALFWSGVNFQVVASAAPWLLAAFGVLGIGAALFSRFNRQPPPAALTPVTGAGIDGQARLDLIHLLDFAVNQTTVLWLTDLIMKAPLSVVSTPFKLDSNTEAAQASNDFVRHVSIQLSQGTFRRQEFLNWMVQAQTEAENQVEQMPQDQRPPGTDPLVLRRCAIANLQCIRAWDFLQRERHEVGQRLIAQRSQLIEQLRLRSPN
jgi:hypothetical protein